MKCRRVLIASAFIGSLGAQAQAVPAQDDSRGPVLFYRQPAKEWVEALPIGNGRLGGMVFGGVPAERIQLNEDTFWSGGPYDAINPEALPYLPKVRELIREGRYKEAQDLADEKLMGRHATCRPISLSATCGSSWKVTSSSRPTIDANWTSTAPSSASATASARRPSRARSSPARPIIRSSSV